MLNDLEALEYLLLCVQQDRFKKLLRRSVSTAQQPRVNSQSWKRS